MTRFRGKATKIGKGWHVEFSDNWNTEEVPKEVKDEVMKLIKGFEDGSIDPMKVGSRMCQYCGEPNDDAPMGVNSCAKCLEDLR